MNNNLKDVLQDESDYFGSIIQELQEQNKRYREAIKGAVKEFNQDEHQHGMAALLKALEETE